MYKKIAEAEHCPTCRHQTKREEYDIFCDWCEAKLDNDRESVRQINVLPENVDDYVSTRPEPEFCDMDCLFKWLRSDKYREWTKIDIVRTGKMSPFDFLSVQQLDRLVEELRK